MGQLFVDALKTAGHITEKKFSIHYTGDDGSNYVDFGTPREEGMSNPSELTYINVEPSFFWQVIP